ncbi:MAG: Fe-S cluster assembly protein HesB [Chloroflexota bacterium]
MTASAMTSLPYTGDPDADAMLAREPLALIIGFILDQRVTIPKAFSGGLLLASRTGGRLDAGAIASMPTAELEALARTPPALHRFPNMMARRVQQMCVIVVRDYGGDAAGSGRPCGRGRGGATAARAAGNLDLQGALHHRHPRATAGDAAPGLGGPCPDEPSMVDVVDAASLRAYQLS